jgi:hypothetical protein
MSQDVLISVGADVSALTRELSRAATLAQDFGRQLARAAGTLPDPRINAGAYQAAGQAAGRAFSA